MLVNAYINYFSQSYNDALCIKQGDRRFSYQEFSEQIDRLAATLQQQGICAEDRIAVLSYNCAEQFIFFYAAMRIGAIYLPINFRLAPAEIAYILNDSEASVVFAEGSDLIAKINLAENLSKPFKKVQIGATDSETLGWISLNDYQNQTDQTTLTPFKANDDTLVYQMYTSGTTGAPKGVMISHRQLSAFLTAYSIMPPHIAAGKAHLAVAPLFHAAAFSLALAALSSGRPVVILPSFDPVAVLATISAEKIADTLLVPAMIQALLTAIKQLPSAPDISSLECLVYGGSAITEAVLAESAAYFNCDFLQGFGMTEMVTGVIWLTPEDHRRALKGDRQLLRSCGKPCAFNEMKVIDPDSGAELAPGCVGEIVIKGEQMMSGYWKQPDKTAEALKDGWYHTGDAGYINDDGYLFIKDRIKDMVVTGGENVYPAEVENTLASHPQIKEVAVIGVPDQTYGEALKAICVISSGETLAEAELIDFCRNKIAGYKIPRIYAFIAALPRNAAGKVLKNTLRETHSN